VSRRRAEVAGARASTRWRERAIVAALALVGALVVALGLARCGGPVKTTETADPSSPASSTDSSTRDAPSIRLLDRLTDWKVDSPWSPNSTTPLESGVAPVVALDFESKTTADGLAELGVADAQLAGPLPGTPPLQPNARPTIGGPPRVAAEAAASGRAGLRFPTASGAAFRIVELHPDTPYLFTSRVRRAVDPATLASGGDDATRRQHATELARDAQVGHVVLLELHEVPPAGATLAQLLAAIAARQVVVVDTHSLPAGATGSWSESRLAFRSSVYTRALVVGLVGGNPGWWRLPSSDSTVDEPPAGAVDFDDVKLFELPLARWLAQPASARDDVFPFEAPPKESTAAVARVAEFRRKVELVGEARRALLAPVGTTASIELALPVGAWRLSFGYGVVGERRSGFGSKPVEFVARLERDGAPPRELLRESLRPADSVEASAWQEFAFGESSGGHARLVLTTSGDVARGEVPVFGEPKLEPLLAPEARPWNVVLISVDTLRADRVGCYGYARPDGQRTTPHLDEFARECVRFADARSCAPFTLPSHATILTGLSPHVHRVVRAGRRVTSRVHPLLAEEFGDAGYATGAFTGGAFLSFEYGFHAGFDRYSILDAFLTAEDPYRGVFPRPDDRAWNDAAYAHHDLHAIERWVETQIGRPYFLFVHTYVAHDYRPKLALEQLFVGEEAARRLGPDRDLKRLDIAAASAGHSIEPEVARAASDVYDAAVATADESVGALLEWLRASGRLDKAVVAIVSDHGEEFGEHGGLLHGRTLYEEMLRVPFLLRVPGVAPRVVSETVDLADVAPTLRALAGLAPVAPCDGRDLLARLRDDEFADAFYAEVSAPGLARRRALRVGSSKWVTTPGTGGRDAANGPRDFEEREYAARRAPEFELYDLATDSRERTNLAGAPENGAAANDAERSRKMRARLDARVDELRRERGQMLADPRSLEYALDADEARRLRELGYVLRAGEDDDD
jgi:arylsulfatase A-like enzyme